MSRKGAETQRDAHGFALTRWVNACLLASASSSRLCAFARHPIAGFNLKAGMETTDDTDGTDRKGLAADGVLTPWVNRFRPSTGLIFFIRGICVIRGKSHRRFQG